MKKYKFIGLMLIFLLIFTTFSSVFAEQINYSLEVIITDVTEPVDGARPNFNYDVDFDGPFESSIIAFDSMCWLEYDEDYDEVYDYYDEVDDFNDMYYVFDSAVRGSYNRYNEYQNWGSLPMPNFTKFVSGKTYAAVYMGSFQINTILQTIEQETIQKPISNEMVRANTSTSQKQSLTLSSQKSPSASSPIYTTVNGKDENVFVVINTLDQERSITAGELKSPNYVDFAIIALFEIPVPIPTQNYKATVNWKNAEGKIPDSFVLKLMNGTTVVKEQVVTKENAVKDGVWEYDFGEYPTIDEDGNEITYTLAYSEGKAGDLKLFNTTVNGFTIDNTYVEPQISSKVKMRSLVDRETNNVKYKIDYNASIKKYSGNADVQITTTLPFAIDETKSNLDEGTYDATTRSITWNHTIENIDNTFDYTTTKNLDLYATAVLPYAIEATTVGEVTLSDAEGFSESVDTVDTVESGTGNPKTGDINLQKYLSIGLIGLAAILMVVSIRRKYSTKKSKVQF